MTAILVEHRRGSTRRCDAICHLARGRVCECLCGGRYHGMGLGPARARLEADLAAGGEYASEIRKLVPSLVLRQLGQRWLVEEATGA